MYEEALKSYETACQVSPSDHEYHRNRANCLREMKKYQEAVEAFKTAIRLSPDDVVCRVKLADFLEKDMHVYDEAIEHLDAAISLEPTNHCLYINKANCLAKLERREEALVFYDKALSLESCGNEAEIMVSKAFSLMRLDRCDEALALVDKCMALEPNEENVYLLKAEILDQLQRYDEATECELQVKMKSAMKI